MSQVWVCTCTVSSRPPHSMSELEQRRSDCQPFGYFGFIGCSQTRGPNLA